MIPNEKQEWLGLKLADHRVNFIAIELCQWVERMYLCGFVALYVRMFVAGANKVEDTMSWCVGTNAILASNR